MRTPWTRDAPRVGRPPGRWRRSRLVHVVARARTLGVAVGAAAAALILWGCATTPRLQDWDASTQANPPDRIPPSVTHLVVTGDAPGRGPASLAQFPDGAPFPTHRFLWLHIAGEGHITLRGCEGVDAGATAPPSCGALANDDPVITTVASPSRRLPTVAIDAATFQAARWSSPARIEIAVDTQSAPTVEFVVLPRLPTSVDERDRLTAALRGLPSPAPDIWRILVCPTPVETGGPGGQGGRDGHAVFHRLPASLRAAIVAGTFDGVVSAQVPGVEWIEDLDPAIQRSSKQWVTRPLFQLSVQGMGRPGPQARGMPWQRGTSARPTVAAAAPGFARLDLGVGVARPSLWIFLRQKWWGHVLPWRSPGEALSPRRPAPSMAPCRDCDPAQNPTVRP